MVFFTREFGLVRAVYKGGRLPAKQRLLQAFTPLWGAFHERTSACYVQQLESHLPALSLQGTHLLAGLYVNELIYHALQTMDAYPRLFDAYETVLRGLAQSIQPAVLAQSLREFEGVLLREMGYHISLQHEATSGAEILPEKHYILSVEEGLVEVSKGIPGEYLVAWANQQWHLPQVRQTAKTVMRQMLDHALGGKLMHTRKLLSTRGRFTESL